MSTIYEAFRTQNREIVKYDGAVGVEIETECLIPYDYPKMKFWNPVTDGSLRHYGVEYVLRQPLSVGKDLDSALGEFMEKTARIQFIEDSISTSVHVHLNFLNETFLSMANFLTVYSLFENVLIRYSGPDRLSNLFCLPLCDAEQNVEYIVQMLTHVSRMSNRFTGVRAEPERMKYAALNLASFPQRGSLEVRSFRGTTDIALIQKWVSMLSAMQDYARQVESPTHIIEFYKNSGIELLDVVFGKYAEELRYGDLDEMIKKNLWYSARVATATKDWSSFGKFENKKATKKQVKKYFEDYAQMHFNRSWAELDPAQRIVVVEAIERDGVNIAVVAQEEEPAEEPEQPVVVNELVGNLRGNNQEVPVWVQAFAAAPIVNQQPVHWEPFPADAEQPEVDFEDPFAEIDEEFEEDEDEENN